MLIDNLESFSKFDVKVMDFFQEYTKPSLLRETVTSILSHKVIMTRIGKG